jgi:hypothetical protein
MSPPACHQAATVYHRRVRGYLLLGWRANGNLTCITTNSSAARADVSD